MEETTKSFCCFSSPDAAAGSRLAASSSASSLLLQGPDPRGQRPEAQRLLLGKVREDLAVERDVLGFDVPGDKSRIPRLFVSTVTTSKRKN